MSDEGEWKWSRRSSLICMASGSRTSWTWLPGMKASTWRSCTGGCSRRSRKVSNRSGGPTVRCASGLNAGWPTPMTGCLPRSRGLYTVTPKQIEGTHRAVLFDGATECCDGTALSHNSVLLSVIQIGLAHGNIQGSQGTWVNRLYRRDLDAQCLDPLEEVMDLLRRRQQRSIDDDAAEGENRRLSPLVRRSLMDYAERAALLTFSEAPWRMGHGNPIASESARSRSSTWYMPVWKRWGRYC